MKVDYIEMELAPIGFLSRDPSESGADLVKGFLKKNHTDESRLSYWQIILLQSKANGCSYRGEDLPPTNWQWPKNTWFQERLSHLGKHSNSHHSEAVPKRVRGPA